VAYAIDVFLFPFHGSRIGMASIPQPGGAKSGVKRADKEMHCWPAALCIVVIVSTVYRVQKCKQLSSV
jgi:hypothetical protein